MASIPSNISRVPNLLASQVLLSNLNRTNLSLFRTQDQMATGSLINRFSDDSIGASAVSVLRQRLARGEQQLGNLTQADGTLSLLDSSLGDLSGLLEQARSIASEQIGVGSDTQTRAAQAVVIDGMIRQMFDLANRQSNGLYLFGGSTATRRPMLEVPQFGGFRYVARGEGMTADLGPAFGVPVTLGGNNAIGATSARVRSTRDLDPELTADTRLADLRGAQGLGVRPGVLRFAFNGGPAATVDLSGAEDVQDVLDALTSALQQYETDHGVTILGAGGVSLNGGSLSIDVVSGAPDPDPQLTFADVSGGTIAADLGLSQSAFENTAPDGADLDPRLTFLTPLSALPGLTLPMDGVRIKFQLGANTAVRQVDLSGAQTIGDVRSLIEAAAPGVRVLINENGRGIDIVSEVSGPAMSIEEIAGDPDTATELGIRSLDLGTLVSDFNHGRGVHIVHGSVDPVTGLPDPTRDVDFRITLGSGQSFDVDLRPQDLVNVQSLLDRINAAFAAAVLAPPINPDAPPLEDGDFEATLTDGANGIAFVQSSALAADGPIAVVGRNNSGAAEDLGLLAGTYDAGSATLVAQDRASIKVDNLFTALIELREALRSDSTTGITFAGERLERAVNHLSQTRALVGAHANRVARAITRLEDSQVLDEKLRSQLQDLDYAEAATRFTMLQTQLQAALASGAQTNRLSLLDFLR